ncbi:MAG: ABC transporter substrate-binding protein [Rhizobiales bacterium]|nr:ABC transporter substrate-binding protein [Hyphomicrobiales bacterium]
MKSIIAALAFAGLVPLAAHAQEAPRTPIRIGFVSTFSGPSGQLGQELLLGFRLGIASTGGTLGGRPVEIIEGDDQAKPDVGRQLVDKMIESNRVQIITGINFSNVLLAVAKPALDAGAFVISVNAGPSQLAGRGCHPRFFAAAFQNDTSAEAMGLHLTAKGIRRVYLMAPNYPAGRDYLNGFKRTFKGEIVGEVYTAFGQLDYAAEIAQLRAAGPEAVFFFYPGGMGINFVKQYAQAGLRGTVPLYGPSFSLDQTVLPAIGEAALGAFASSFWSESLDNAASRKFVADFEAAHGRIPAPYAAQGYDAARLIDAALKSIGGRIEDKAAFQRALETVTFDTVRGRFRFNTNHFPIQDFYLNEIVKDERGRLVMGLRERIIADYPDAYAGECRMRPATN